MSDVELEARELLPDALGGYASLEDFADNLNIVAEIMRDNGFHTASEEVERAAKVILALKPSPTRNEVLEEAARVAETSKGEWFERVLPAHTEFDDFGDPIMEVPERVQKFMRLPSPKSIAKAIRTLKSLPPSPSVNEEGI